MRPGDAKGHTVWDTAENPYSEETRYTEIQVKRKE